MTKTFERRTLTDQIVFSLTEDIVSQRLPPGHALDEGRIGLRFGASRTPVREAIRQLAASGLVQLRPHRSPLVTPIDTVRLAEMFDVMSELEALCVQRASALMTLQERKRLELHHMAMGEAVRAGGLLAYREGNAQFHALLYEGAHNAYLRDLALSTRERLAAYRGAQLGAPARLAQSYVEHDAILTAVLRGQGVVAADLMRQHLGNTQSQIGRMAEDSPTAD